MKGDVFISSITYSTSVETLDSDAVAQIIDIISKFAIIGFIVLIITIIGMWKIFSKAGQAGWKSLIPIYNLVTLFKIAGISPWLVLGYLASIIPVIGGLVALGITIYYNVKLAKAFGKSGLFAVGLILFNPIFTCILGFGSAQYEGVQE